MKDARNLKGKNILWRWGRGSVRVDEREVTKGFKMINICYIHALIPQNEHWYSVLQTCINENYHSFS